MSNIIRLDDLYKMVSHIYSEQNFNRSVSATLCHFVEVCGMLTIHDRRKRKQGIDVTDALCKALGWYFPLLAKMRVKSVEDIVFRKFPTVCPYCRCAPHDDSNCKLVRGTEETVSHQAVQRFYKEKYSEKPISLDEWQKMFQKIYPRQVDDRGRSTIGLFEEIGELAEAVRVFERHPKYFAGEAADAFSYLMGIANEHKLRMAQEERVEFSFEAEFLARYPGLCTQCGSKICVCPAVPEATVGRMTKEMDIAPTESLFLSEPGAFSEEGAAVSRIVLDRIGGHVGLIERFPFDRGDANKALIMLCIGLADAVQKANAELADHLRAEALRIGSAATYAGSRQHSLDVTKLLSEIREVWRSLDSESKKTLAPEVNEIATEIVKGVSKLRVLYVYCSPSNQASLRVASELRVIRDAASRSMGDDGIVISDLPAATIDDLRNALLISEFEIVHFSGHSNQTHLSFEDERGESTDVPIERLASFLKKYESIQCVILNSCESAKTLTMSITAHTVGMDSSIDDAAAIEFSRGFYDALSAGRSIAFAAQEGRDAAALKGLDDSMIRYLSTET